MTGIAGLTTLKALRSLKGPRLDLYGFYLVIINLNIRWVLIKYNIKPLGMTKTQGFTQDLYVYVFFIPVETTWKLHLEPKGTLKKPTDFY